MEDNNDAVERNEQRKHERKPTNVTIDVTKDGELHKERAKNVSFSGIYIENTDFEKYDVDEDVVLSFESQDAEPQSVEATIVRKDKKGAGMQFKKRLVSMKFKCKSPDKT